MIHYIIQSTAIWLLSLLAFELFLRRTNLHAYNRAYLLTTLLLGALLPLYHPAKTAVNALLPERPFENAAVVEQHITQAVSNVHSSGSWAQWSYLLYAVGVCAALALLLREALTLAKWYREGKVQRHNGYRLVTTGRNHGPFSLLRCIFVSDPARYSAHELRMILAHESAHIHRLHYLDKALALLLRCIFWAHPLIYIYYRRLIMVHEYEADNTAKPQATAFAEFLIRQYLEPHLAPLLTHSFFHSPLKNRINMLSKSPTPRIRRIACLLALPLMISFSILWVTKTAAHQKEQRGNLIVFNGNQFELGMPVINGKPASTGQLTLRRNEGGTPKNNATPMNASDAPEINHGDKIVFQLSPIPQKMNGEPIYDESALTTKANMPGEVSLKALLVKAAAGGLSELPDGEYRFSVMDLITDKTGNIVYYTLIPTNWYSETKVNEMVDVRTLTAMKQAKAAHPVPQPVQDKVNEGIERLLDNLQIKPATKDGYPVIAHADNLVKYVFGGVVVIVRDHNVMQKPGC